MLESSALSFPPSPTINQTYDFQGKTFSWNGIGWRQVSPSFQLVNPTGIERLAYGSVNAVATLDIVLAGWTTRYRGFLFKLAGFIPVTDGVSLYARFSTDGGATFNAGATDYDHASLSVRDDSVLANTGSGGTTQIDLIGSAVIGNGTAEGYAGSIELLKPTSAALWSRITHQGYFVDNQATPITRTIIGGGAREAAQDTDAIRFLFSSGNISTGDYAVYGYT